MSPEQAKKILDTVHDVKAWAGGLLDKCAQLEKLVEESGAVSTAPKQSTSVLTLEQRAEIAAKQRARYLKLGKGK